MGTALPSIVMGLPTHSSCPSDESILSQAYQPIIRGYFYVAAAYYAIMSCTQILELKGTDFLFLETTSVTACIAAIAAGYALRKPLPIGALEAITSLINLFILANVLVALEVEFNQAKLVYFIILVMAFAFASVSTRQAILSIAVALGCLFFEVIDHEPGQLGTYGFLSFAAALSAISIAFFLRRAIGLAVSARAEADLARQDAEARLTAAERLSETMRQLSLTDSLTKLPNRRAFFEAIQKSRKQDHNTGGTWLALVDLDGFKTVNDSYGHIMGDELLKAVASRLLHYCGTDAKVCRVGGDEFNIIYSSDCGEDGVEIWCSDLLVELAAPYLIADRIIQISGSIGCYELSHDEADTKMIQKADYALLRAKKHGKNRVIIFKEEHAKDANERFRIESTLRDADFSAEIELVFQPQFDLSQNKIVCAEALARWNSPTLGRVAPAEFIKVAEESGMIAGITLAVLNKALASLNSWSDPIPISINLSGHDLNSDPIINQIIQYVRAAKVAPHLLEFEVTETAMMSDMRKASANLRRLSALGHSISLDDFGTGYSNFSYLRTLPIDKLKIDRGFIEDITDPMTEKILHSLTGIASTLGVHCLLEGVENELQLAMAKRAGAQSVQGFLFGRPMSEAELREMLSAQSQLVPAQHTDSEMEQGLELQDSASRPKGAAKIAPDRKVIRFG